MRRMYVFVLVWLVAIALVYLFGQANLAFLSVASNIISPASALLPALYSLVLVRRYGSDPKHRFARIWVSLTVGLFLWLLGEITWSVYYFVLSVEVPYPSIADLFWVVGYFPIMVFMIGYVMPFKEAFSSRKIAGAVGAALLAALVVFSVLVGPVLSLGEEPLTQLFDLAYPALDIVLLGVSIAGMVLFLPGKLSRFWAWFNLGLIFIVIADLIFSYSTALDFYYTGHPLELFYFLGDSAILLGLYEHKHIF